MYMKAEDIHLFIMRWDTVSAAPVEGHTSLGDFFNAQKPLVSLQEAKKIFCIHF